MSNNIIVDGHCDTIKAILDENINLENRTLGFNLIDAWNNRPVVQNVAAFVNPIFKSRFERTRKIIENYNKEIEKYPNKIIKILNSTDIEKVREDNKIGLLLSIENGSAIEDNLENIDYFYNNGVRLMSITWNEDNLLGCGALTNNDTGLTSLGKEYVKKLNEKNIIIDISHASPKTFWDTIKISNKPIVATHSCSFSICNHPRNLTDDQIKTLAKNGGIIGVCFANAFLSNSKNVEIKDIVKHIKHIVNLVGIDFVGLGSDFEGLEKEELPLGLKGIKDIKKLKQELRKEKFNEEEIDKIMGENWVRVLKKQI